MSLKALYEDPANQALRESGAPRQEVEPEHSYVGRPAADDILRIAQGCRRDAVAGFSPEFRSAVVVPTA